MFSLLYELCFHCCCTQGVLRQFHIKITFLRTLFDRELNGGIIIFTIFENVFLILSVLREISYWDKIDNLYKKYFVCVYTVIYYILYIIFIS